MKLHVKTNNRVPSASEKAGLVPWEVCGFGKFISVHLEFNSKIRSKETTSQLEVIFVKIMHSVYLSACNTVQMSFQNLQGGSSLLVCIMH